MGIYGGKDKGYAGEQGIINPLVAEYNHRMKMLPEKRARLNNVEVIRSKFKTLVIKAHDSGVHILLGSTKREVASADFCTAVKSIVDILDGDSLPYDEWKFISFFIRRQSYKMFFHSPIIMSWEQWKRIRDLAKKYGWGPLG